MPNAEDWLQDPLITMFYDEDWLQDPLIEISKSFYKSRKPKNFPGEQHVMWDSFHFATRLKLDGANYFCRQVLGAASMPDDLGLPLLAHRQLIWYLDAFFVALMSAYDTLKQELNIVYAYDLKLEPKYVEWEKIKKKLPRELCNYMDKEWNEEWFYKIRMYRNIATHEYHVPTGSGKVGFGGAPLDYSEHDVSMYYLDKAGKFKREDISECVNCLKKMVNFISHIWIDMAEEFE